MGWHAFLQYNTHIHTYIYLHVLYTYTHIYIHIYIICPIILHLRIYPTVIAASVQNHLCVNLFILAMLVTIQEEQSQLLVEN